MRIILWAAIAVALVKMAFTGTEITPAAHPLRPTAEIVPVAAAVTDMACATAVGALAGLIPAIVAVRVKVIGAIRY